MRTLAIDIETYSGTDLKSAGVYRYVEDPDFEVLLFAYAFDDEPVAIVDLACGEAIPDKVVSALVDPAVIKTAFNANFERTCLRRHFAYELSELLYDVPFDMAPEQWRCTQVHSLALGLPISLELVAKALTMGEQKDNAGKALIRYFSIPCAPTKANGGRRRNLPEHDPEKWARFKDYCIQDVVVEREIRKRLSHWPLPDSEWALWALDQKINDRGVRVDLGLVRNAIKCDELHQERLKEEAIELTGLANPNSLTQLKGWLQEKTGQKVESLTKETVPALLESTTDGTVRRVLEIRQELSKTSIKKYKAMDTAVCPDGRIRGILKFYGASRTGRWSGRIIQPQNLPRNYLPDLDEARNLVCAGDYDSIELLYGTAGTLSQLIRPALIPSSGRRFIVVDFSAIEARIIAWLAGEKWRLEVFNSHGKIYEASASQMFNVPLEEIGKGSPLRQKGKVAELACGYQGSVGALRRMDSKWADSQSEEELQGIVNAWREANKNIVKLWARLEEMAVTTVREREEIDRGSGILFAKLPSGRSLAYLHPRIENEGRFKKASLTYEGYVENGHWGRCATYGGKLAENLVQAIARDCLAEALRRVDAAGYDIVFHVHDEIIVEAPHGEGSVEDLVEILSMPIDWAPGLPLTADGFEADYYVKE